MATYIRAMSPDTKIIGVQPRGAESMLKSFEANQVIEMPAISRFCDGSAVPTVP